MSTAPKISVERLLTVTTPLEPNTLLIEGFGGTETVSGLFKYKLHLLAEKGKVVALRDLLGGKIGVGLLQKPGQYRCFHGIISRAAEIGHDERFNHYEVDMHPWLWVLTQRANCRIFQAKTIPEILTDIFEEAKSVCPATAYRDDTRGEHIKLDYCVQYRETDFNFVSRLMEQEGIFYYFEHDEDSHTLVFADSNNTLQPCPGKSTFFYQPMVGYGEREDSVLEWKAEQQLRAGKYTLRDFHFELPDNSLQVFEPSTVVVANNDEMEIYDYPGEYAQRFNAPEARLGGVQPEGRKLVRARMETEEFGAASFSGVSDSRYFIAGYKFTLQGDRGHSGKFILTSVSYHTAQSPGYLSGEEADEPHRCLFTCCDVDRRLRPERLTPKPFVQGPQTAIVVGKKDEDIWTDKYGRVKVQFHWDREGKHDENSSCWVRVSQPWAGKAWGGMWIPRIGQEVVVEFLEGDPDQPIITGRVYNAAQVVPYELPKWQTMSTMKSHSTKEGGTNDYNELRFDDNKGKEQVFFRAQRRMDVRVKGSYYDTCHGNRNTSIGWENEENSAGDFNLTVKGDHQVHVLKGRYEQVDEVLNYSVGQNAIYDLKQTHADMVAQKAEINAQQVIIEAAQKIGLKVGGNFITIDASGITMNGTMVKINSGGWGVETGDYSFEDPLDAVGADTGVPGALEAHGTGAPRRRNRRTLRSQHMRFPPAAGEAAGITALRNRLQLTATGRHALDAMQRFNIGTRVDTSDGYYYDPATNTITMDTSMDPNFQATGMVHEVNHGEAANTHTTPDITGPDRHAYVDGSLREEAHGDALANQYRREMEARGEDMSSSEAQSQTAYDQGYNQGYQQAQANNPDGGPEAWDAAARQAGEQAVYDDYHAGNVQASTPGNPAYTDLYGGYWDDAHATP